MMEYGLIGEKLGHSYSKIIHELLADYTYELCPLNRDELEHFMTEKAFKAINVTIPYKREVIPFLSSMDEKAKKIGAVNTIVNVNQQLVGYNTDYDGFLYTLNRHNITIKDQKVLVLGNGGAAQAVFAVLHDLDAKEVITVKYKEEPGTVTYKEAAVLHKDAAIIVNTTPVGMYPNCDASPIDLTPYNNLSSVIDIIYNPAETKLLAQARELNIQAVNGLWMLISQAKCAAQHFLGIPISDDVIPGIHDDIMEMVKKQSDQ